MAANTTKECFNYIILYYLFQRSLVWDLPLQYRLIKIRPGLFKHEKIGPYEPELIWLYYYLHMWVGNVFSYVFVSVCVPVCSGYKFWNPSHRTFIFGMEIYLCHIYLSIKVIGSIHMTKNYNLFISTCYSLLLRSLIRSMSHIEVKVKSRSLLRKGTLTLVICIWLKCVLVQKEKNIDFENAYDLNYLVVKVKAVCYN